MNGEWPTNYNRSWLTVKGEPSDSVNMNLQSFLHKHCLKSANKLRKGKSIYISKEKKNKHTRCTSCSFISSFTSKASSILYMTDSESAVVWAWYVAVSSIDSRLTTPYKIKTPLLFLYRKLFQKKLVKHRWFCYISYQIYAF